MPDTLTWWLCSKYNICEQGCNHFFPIFLRFRIEFLLGTAGYPPKRRSQSRSNSPSEK